jgi:hypothetical protein
MKTSEVLKRDNLLVEFLGEHRGGENCVSKYDIAEYLNGKGFATKHATIHTIVRRLMFERTLPICHANGKGYFWAESRAEIQAAIADLESRIEEMQSRIEHLKHFIIF